jgi:hypothetical protein
MKYLKLFEKQSDYQSFIESDEFVTPNVSFITEENMIFCNPYEEEILSTRVITYTASEKLTETTITANSGLHTNVFNTTIVSHEFVDGVGTIVFEEDVTSIGKSAFRNCSKLTSITIPDSVISIRNYAFYNCKGLTSIEIPDSVTSIENNAFMYCANLTSIVIPDSVTSIGEKTFSECSKLTSINIGSGITSIGSTVFEHCYDLTSIEIPDSVTSIGFEAFRECSNLSSVTIGSGVTSIEADAFGGCSRLNSITCYATTAPTIKSYTFAGIKSNGVLYYPSGSDYSSWLATDSYYLGYFNWTGQEITD